MSKIRLYEKMVAIMTDVGQIQKDGSIEDKDGKLMYNYLSEEVTTSTLQKAFIQHGLVMFPIKVESEVVDLRSLKFDKESLTPITKVIVTYKLACIETGEFEELQSIGYGSDSQDKGSNKAMTSAFKYVQRQSFMISTGEDADHTGSHELDDKNKPDKKPHEPHTTTNKPTQTNTQTTTQTGSTGQSGTVSNHPSMRIFALQKELGWKTVDLNEFISTVLGKEVKYPLKDYVKTPAEWALIEEKMTVTKVAS